MVSHSVCTVSMYWKCVLIFGWWWFLWTETCHRIFNIDHHIFIVVLLIGINYYSISMHNGISAIKVLPSREANCFQPVRIFHECYRTRRFITAYRSAGHLSLPLARSIHTMHKHPNSWRIIFVLSSPLGPCLLSGPFPSGVPTKNMDVQILSAISTTCPANRSFIFVHQKNFLSSKYN